MKIELVLNNLKIGAAMVGKAEIEITPEVLAELFWNMDERQQANFFCWLGDNASPSDFTIQMHSVERSNQLTDNARWVMNEIGIYSEKDVQNT